MELGSQYWEKGDYKSYLKTKLDALEMYEQLNLGNHIGIFRTYFYFLDRFRILFLR